VGHERWGTLPWKQEVWLWAGVTAVGSTAVTGGLLADAIGLFGTAALTTSIATAAAPLLLSSPASDVIGRAREWAVAELTGGRVVNDLKLMTLVGGRVKGVKVDVIGGAGELIAVGGFRLKALRR
jgi:hypothetical protein